MPILILIFINDLPDALDSCIIFFADDAKLYLNVNSLVQANQLQGNVKGKKYGRISGECTLTI